MSTIIAQNDLKESILERFGKEHKFLAHGSMARVFAVDDKVHGKIAVKILPNDGEEASKAAMLNEVAVLKSCQRSPFIVRCHTYVQGSDFFAIGMEYCEQGDLFDHLQSNDLSYQSMQLCVIELGLALQHLHRVAGCIHEDLKPENVGISKAGHVKLLDFGSSTRTKQGGVMCTHGTVQYACPEKLQRVPHSFEADWWSYGVLIFELVFGFLPWHGNTDDETATLICTQPIEEFGVSDAELVDVMDLIHALLHKDVNDRLAVDLGFEELLEEKFFANIDLEGIQAGKYPPFRPSKNVI